MMATTTVYKRALITSTRRSLSSPLVYRTIVGVGADVSDNSFDCGTRSRHPDCALNSTKSSAASSLSNVTSNLLINRSIPLNKKYHFPQHQLQQTRTILSSSSFSALPPDEEEKEKARVESLTPYQKEMELRTLDSELARLQTLRGINTGELYTMRGKFKMLSRDYGMGFLAWYWTVWFGTAGLSYLAIELGGIDPIVVASKVENFLGWEAMSISGRLDPTLGQIGLVVAVNECLEPLRLPFVVVTTKPVVNMFSKRS